MKHLKTLIFTMMLIALFGSFNSCSDNEDIEMDTVETFSQQKASNVKAHNLNIKGNTELKNFLKRYQSGEDIKQEFFSYLKYDMLLEELGPDRLRARNFILSIINPDDFVCDDSDVPISNYLDSTLVDFTFFDIILYFIAGDYPQIDAIFFKEIGERQSYGIDGEFTNQLNRSFKDLKRFWDIPSDDINMFAMKGTTFANFDRILTIESILYPEQTMEENLFWVNLYQEVFGSDLYWNYNHPLLSFNAFAISTPFPGILDRIVMGDGILTAYEAIGLGDVAPQAILAHEYAHHIQFENGYFEQVPPEFQPAATRRTELMADAYAAYYLTHKRGATLNAKRVVQFLDVFYNIGDCSFDAGGHHGTFEQRLAAAQFGFQLADDTQKKGQIMSAEEFFVEFEDSLNDIIFCDSCVAK